LLLICGCLTRDVRDESKKAPNYLIRSRIRREAREGGYPSGARKFLLGPPAVSRHGTVGCTRNISAFRPLIYRVLSLPRTAPSRVSVVLPRLKRDAEFSKWIITRRARSSSLCRARKRATWFRSSERLSSYYRLEL